ncbi:uncharacterized protein AB675_6244 [Cyphellophora attinorum]|uniref:FHA domain-containing protein n=1 Tax=Cyphellophora attinorum TaxID=1664694 RepID=A0A0N1H8Z2_9EURO|nr:uncharacterized protein AB675_6244 [Phialophora attinorum]KPI43684.1 hypothetical protein AB675_6244 [Phialophora attinorum]
MTTAVASPPNLQSLPRVGWNGGSTGGFSAMSSEDVSRIFMPPSQRKNGVQRSNSSTSLASTASNSSTSSTSTTTDVSSAANGDNGTTAAKKKTRGGFWPVSKAESTSGVSAARANGSVQLASVLSGKAPVQPVLPSAAAAKTNGIRIPNGTASQDSSALLALLPMNGTFERKQINVPFSPDTMRVGRQTNAKTVPTPTNGYFDSKVLSRQHAEVWADREGRVWIRDVKSSNGTFVNGQRLSLENRESEPHQLRQHDTLELGIDIVSEDQKTIVHHKVSAKVEFVGLPGASNNVLDLSFGDLDPSHGGALLPSPLSTPLLQQRNRAGGLIVAGRSAPSSVAGGQMSAAAQNRQMNLWGPPLSVEHLVKQISHEMRAAKQQSTDLDHIEKSFAEIVAPLKDTSPNQADTSPTDEANIKPASHRSRSFKNDNLARFSDPPAPPPQQPLPEKPDSTKSSSMNPLNLTSFLKRSDTAKASSPATSPSKKEAAPGSDHLAILELVRKDLDSQKARVKELEDMLMEEKTARIRAEERARQIEQDTSYKPVTKIEEPPVVLPELGGDHPSAQQSTKEDLKSDPVDEKQLQQRLDTMVLEMQKMKTDMDRYQQRAEVAEADAVKTRETLTEMIERLRQENDTEAPGAIEKAVNSTKPSRLRSLGTDGSTENMAKGQDSGRPTANGHVTRPRVPSQLEQAVATALRHSRSGDGEVLAQSAPFVSAMGVVLIGIGLMAYLNSWQKTDK